MRKLLTIAYALAVFALVGLPSHANAATANTLVKASTPTIYWVATDGKKYAFPNINTFYTWFSSNDFKAIKKISPKQLNAIPKGGDVTYRGGAKLVKFPNDSTVYAVSRYSTLRPLANSGVAEALYGWNWSNLVETLPWNLRGDYAIGATINSSTDYSVSGEYNGVSTPSDNLSIFNPSTVGYQTAYPSTSGGAIAPVFTGTMQIALSNRLYNPERVTITASLTNSNRSANAVTIQIRNATRNEVLQTCYATYTCSTTWNVDTVAAQDIIAVANDGSGYTLGSNRVNVQGVPYTWYPNNDTTAYYPYTNWNNTNAYNNGYYPYNNASYPYGWNGYVGTVNLILSQASVYTNDQVTASVSVSNGSNFNSSQLTTEIYVDNSLLGTCPGTLTCALTFNNPIGGVTRNVYARVSTNGAGNWVESTHQTVTVLSKPIASNTDGYYNNYHATSPWHDYYKQNVWNYANNGYTTGPVSVMTYATRLSNWPPSYTVQSNVTNSQYLSNTRLEIYAIDNYQSQWGGAQNRLINTCYGVSSCSAQDTPATSYGTTSYFTTFVDANGQRTNSIVTAAN